MPIFPASGIIPTIDRPEALRRTLESLRSQDWQPREIIVVDASRDDSTRDMIGSMRTEFDAKGCLLIWRRAVVPGAASQRNEGFAAASQPVIWFFDDDILFEPYCLERLWTALQSDPRLGGVSAMIVNQRYQPPGLTSRIVFRLLAGKAADSYAGRVLGPAVNLLPEDRDDLPETVPTEWLNTTCTLYRRSALPIPPFSSKFAGYSLLEDVALSLTVAERWTLASARTARIFHDSQPGFHKADAVALSRMALVNRYYVMVDVLHRRDLRAHAKLALWEVFQLTVSAIQKRLGSEFWSTLYGKLLGLADILRSAMRI